MLARLRLPPGTKIHITCPEGKTIADLPESPVPIMATRCDTNLVVAEICFAHLYYRSDETERENHATVSGSADQDR